MPEDRHGVRPPAAIAALHHAEDPLGAKLLAAKFLDLSGWVRLEIALLNQMVEKSANRHQAPIDARHRLLLVPMEVVAEIHDVTDGDPLDRRTFPDWPR